MRCPSCGRQNRPTATFCASCGTTLRERPLEPFDVGVKDTAQREDDRGATLEMEPDESVGDVPEVGTEVPGTGAPAVRLGPPKGPEAEHREPDHRELEDRGNAGPEEEPEHQTVSDPRAPLAIGDVVADRFEIIELIEAAGDHHRYRARDWSRCPTCGYDDNARGDRYCLDCGAALDVPAYAEVVELLRYRPDAFDLNLLEREREYFVRYEGQAPDEEELPAVERVSAPRLTLRWGRATDTGLQREHNEDYVDCWSYSQGSGAVLGLFIVADGLGGQDAGEVASQMAAGAVWDVLRERVWEPYIRSVALEPEQVRSDVLASVEEANRVVYQARSQASSDMSTTVTLALVVDDQAYIANVGDSRTYLYNAEGLRALTTDHSLVQRLVDAGQIEKKDIYTHPQRNLIYQSVGDRPQVTVDAHTHALQPDDRLLLCSDGLWESLHDDGIEDVLLTEPDPQRACEVLVRHANLAGGEDNISVIVVQAHAE